MAKVDYKQYPVLYVDDERANLVVFRHNFSDQFTVLTADSGEAALAILGRVNVAVLLTDQRMPGMTGVELAEKVQASHPDVARMIVTAYTDVNAAIEAINRGQVSRYITKPWRGEELAHTISAAIELFAMSATLEEMQLKMMRSERLALLGFVAAGIAHDLKSPLTCLQSNIETLQQDLGVLQRLAEQRPEAQPVLAEMRELSADCYEEVQQIFTFIDSIRVLARGQTTAAQAVDLGRVVDSTCRLCKAEVHQRARLRIERGPIGPFVLGDAAQLGQVVLNLIVNAAQAIEPGKTSQHEIKVVVQSGNGVATLAVSDTGKGMAPELVPQIFEPFFTTRNKTGGSGLGLAIVKEILRQHGGDIEVSSEPGKGTTFTVTIPLLKETPALA